MHPLCRQAWLTVPLAVAAVLSVTAFAGAVRAMPWLVDPQVPLAIVWPFARELARAGVEVAVMIGAPLGVALAAASFVDRGQARALGALGESPMRLALHASPPVLVLAALGLVVSLAPRPEPGRLAEELVESGRTTCRDVEVPHAVEVPIVGVTWLCFPGGQARVTGAAPGLGPRARFTAASLVPSPDLSELALGDLRVQVPRGAKWPAISVRAREATVRGVVPWPTGPRRLGRVRAVALALSELLLALALAGVVLGSSEGRRVIWTLAGGLGGAGLLAAAHALDRERAGAPWYLLLPLGSLAVPWLLGRIVLGRRPRAPVARGASR